ncbi:MAG TPA: histidine kinase [Streptosporangiaceae bacterium]|nr:histidine kinase [Streptosporangiaceae bacterium]
MHGVYAWLRRHPRLVDGTLAVLLAAMLTGEPWWGEWKAFLYGPIAACLIIPVVFRRRYPVGTFVIVIATGLVEVIVNPRGSAADLAILIVLYTLTATQSRRIGLIGLAVCLAGGAASIIRWHPTGKHLTPDAIAWAIGIVGGAVVLAWLLGDSARWRRGYYLELEEKTERLERERHALAEVAAAEERARIAREMHDVVAHHVSVMVVQADGAAFALDSTPEKARTAIEAISRTGRQALTEMRRLLGVLRSAEPASLAPLPGIADIPELVAQAGVPVTLAVTGTRLPLPDGAELAAYRAVQEALTNVRKHAGPRVSASVSLAYGPDVLEIAITDDGGLRLGSPAALPVYPTATAAPSGLGLAGMRERAALYGGTVTAGPLPDGGFEVRVRLPCGSSVQVAA